MEYRIAFIDKVPDNGVYQKMFKPHGRLDEIIVDDESKLPDHLMCYDGVIVGRNLTITDKTLSKLSSCKAIVRDGIGFNNIDVDGAKKRDIPVMNISDYCINDVADHAIALLLAYVRKIVYFNVSPASFLNTWDGKENLKINKLENQSIGIIGFGRIGKEVARRALSMRMKVCFYDPNFSGVAPQNITQFKKIEELFAVCKFVSINVPLTEETNNMVNRKILGIALNDLVLINVSRGKVVDLDAVCDSLKENKMEAFLSDVFPDEPPSMSSSLIKAYIEQVEWAKDRLVFSPHIAFFTQEGSADVKERAINNLLLALREGVFVGQVNWC